MRISNSAEKIRLMLEKAIKTHQLTWKEYDEIINLTAEDGFNDPHEKALLHHLHEMLEDKSILIVK